MEPRKLVKADHVVRTNECIEALARIRDISSASAGELFMSWAVSAQAKLYVLPPDSTFAQELNSAEQVAEFSWDELFAWLAVAVDELPAVLGFSLPDGTEFERAGDPGATHVASNMHLEVVGGQNGVVDSSKAGAHVSDHLAYMNQAARLFWANAEKGDPSTHPNNADVAAWLVERGLSATLADKGASIIRPEWAHNGRKPGA